MFYFWALIPILQVVFAIHAYKQGNTFWMYMIIFFFGIGAIIYFFVEFLPLMQRDPIVKSVAGSIEKRVLPNRELQRLKDDVELNNCIKNRVALSDGYLHSGYITEAITLLESCREGAYRNDLQILFSIARAYFEGNKFKEAIGKLELIRTAGQGFMDKDVTLLRAMCCEALDAMEQALREYESILKVSTGEETRCRYALALKKANRMPEALVQFETIIRNARISPGYYKSSQKRWIKIARDELQPRG